MKNFFVDIKNKIISFANKNKKLFSIVVVLVLILVFAIAYSLFFTPNKKSTSQVETAKKVSDDSYESIIEGKISEMLMSLAEVNSASVMVVCETTVVNEYLKNTSETVSTSDATSSKTTTEDVVFEKNGSVNSPIVVFSTFPKVTGVWVIVNNISASTKLAIISSICAVLNIDQSCISILQER